MEALAFAIGFPDPQGVQRDRASGLIAAAHVGCGFMRIRRDCLAALIGAYPGLRYVERAQPEGSRGLVALFDTSLADGAFWGEDYTFCDRWRAIGGRVWVDPEIRLKHIGVQEYEGSLLDSLSPKSG